ncbi:874_t:CDS:2, partial [Funneliformis caledonium]
IKSEEGKLAETIDRDNIDGEKPHQYYLICEETREHGIRPNSSCPSQFNQCELNTSQAQAQKVEISQTINEKKVVWQQAKQSGDDELAVQLEQQIKELETQQNNNAINQKTQPTINYAL